MWTDGGRAAFDFAFAAATTEALTFALEADLQLTMADWLASQLRSGRLSAAIDELLGAGHRADAALLRRWRAAAGMQSPARIYWAGPDASFSKANSRGVAITLRLPFHRGIGFELEVDLPPDCVWVRFDPPLAAGASLHIEQFDFTGADAARLGTARPDQWRGLHDLVSATAGQLRVTGSDPHFRASVPPGSRSLTIRGVLP